MLTTHGWQKTSAVNLWTLIERFMVVGLTHVLCTDVARDGALTGPNLDAVCGGRAPLPGIALAGFRRRRSRVRPAFAVASAASRP